MKIAFVLLVVIAAVAAEEFGPRNRDQRVSFGRYSNEGPEHELHDHGRRPGGSGRGHQGHHGHRGHGHHGESKEHEHGVNSGGDSFRREASGERTDGSSGFLVVTGGSLDLGSEAEVNDQGAGSGPAVIDQGTGFGAAVIDQGTGSEGSSFDIDDYKYIA